MSREVGDYLNDLIAVHGEPTEWIAANRLVQDAILQTGIDRQRKYGHGNIAEFGLHGIVIRATDKIKRMKTMVWSGTDDDAESIEDSAGDLANYGTYAVMLSRRLADGRSWWDLPFHPPD